MAEGGRRALGALARFEVVRRLRWRPWAVAVALYAVFVVLSYRVGSTAWMAEATFGLLVPTLHVGLGVDRELGYDQSMVSNWVGPSRYLGAKLLSLGLALGGTAGIVAAIVLIASPGEWGQAAWYALLFLGLALWFLPLIVLVEVGMESRLPLVGAAGVAAVAALCVAWTAGPESVGPWLLGAVPRAHRLETLGPLVERALGVSLPLSAALMLPVARRIAVRGR